MSRNHGFTEQIWQALRDHGPLTTDALAWEIGEPHATVTAALGWLVRRGRIEKVPLPAKATRRARDWAPWQARPGCADLDAGSKTLRYLKKQTAPPVEPIKPDPPIKGVTPEDIAWMEHYRHQAQRRSGCAA
ncbi:MAG TPA: hypothetical protein PLC99_22350 [Verrucomicrobiota bacterium]|nr:hypothetical protein [Verrucomicrobiota bacterium]